MDKEQLKKWFKIIAFFVASDICIAPVSCLAQLEHLKPLSFMLKYFKFSFSPHWTHSLTSGIYPIIFNNLNLKTEVTKSKFLSVSEIA